MSARFFELLAKGPLVFDGGIGTRLYERGIYVNKSFDHANLSNPDLVEAVHGEYLEAGADVLTANTFSSNRIKLRRHGLEEQTAAINRAGVEIARRVATTNAFVAGSIGPTGQTPTMLTDRELEVIRQAFREQARALAEAGADLIILETFRQMSEIRLAMEAVQEVCDLPLIAQMSFDRERKTGDGASPERVAMLLNEWGADVVGANCMEGPHVLFDVVVAMRGFGVPVIAQPNAGYPRNVDQRLVYMATPEYFGVYGRRFLKAGVDLIGGCCGTGPEHIRQLAAAARMVGGGRKAIEVREVTRAPQPPAEESAESSVRPTDLATKIRAAVQSRLRGEPVRRENFVVSVEVNPPAGLDPAEALQAARMLVQGGVDVINIADGPRASVRMANWALGHLMQTELDIEVILHLCGRDRNLLGLQSDLLGFQALNLHNLVVITGDPPKVGDYPHATAVFDLDSVGILRMIRNFNHGIDPAGKSVGASTAFYCACGAEPAAMDYDRELRRLEKKKQAGASFIMTQPVYDPAVLDRFLEDTRHLELPVMVGLLPLASYRNAEFLHHEVPGMAVPDEIRARMKAVGSGPEARREGVAIAQETLERIKDRVVGAYIMPPFRRFSAALEILSALEGYEEVITEG